MNIKDQKTRFDELNLELKVREARRDMLETSLAQVVTELRTLTDEVNLLEKVDQAFLLISTKVLGKSLKSTDDLVSAGLKLVFEDLNLKFVTQVDKSRGRTAVFFDVEHDGKSFPLMESYGGGVLAVVGVLLRVVVIMATGSKRLLVLDETLAHLSEQYTAAASKLLKKICDELDFRVVLVTHAPEFATYSDRHYEAELKNGELVMVRKV